ncbi:MAG TPA: phosphatidylglycerophosphatase A [Bdellovibrionota bacterium]|nr:phosphatidylglycerophosphatase A [Bdellovibrionota bacterium]
MKKPKDVAVTLVATFFGSGLLPKAPGTAGTVASLPLVALVNMTDSSFRLIFWTLVIAGGIWAAREYDQLMGSHDNYSIVIVEVAGMGLAAWGAGAEPITLILAFIAFRVLDIYKPSPIRQVDEWSKTQTGTPGAIGVMADDVIAGIIVAIAVALLQWVHILP